MAAPCQKPPAVWITSRQQALRVPRKRIVALIAAVAAAEGRDVAEVDLAVVGDQEMAALNEQYARHRGVTDVLSFDLSDAAEGPLSAQIVICADEAVRQATQRGLGKQQELMRYVVHGLLHLMGYDDTAHQAAARMNERQDQLLLLA